MSTNIQKQPTDNVELPEEQKLKNKYTGRNMLDMAIVLIAGLVMAFYYYGMRALLLSAISMATAVVCEWLGAKIFRSEMHITDLSALTTGAAVALCLPASSEWWLPCAASAFAILAAKTPFGSYKNSPFVPAAAGLAFVTICSPQRVFGYSALGDGFSSSAVYLSDNFVAGDSVAYMLSKGNSIGTNIINYIDILVGNFPGAMGATCVLAMLGGLIFVTVRRPKTAAVTLSFLGVCFVYAILFPRITTGRLTSAFMELSAGLLLFAAAVFLTYPNIAPKRFVARICYGAFAGLVLMLLRSFSSFEDSTVFAILLANAVAPSFDNRIPLTKREKLASQKEVPATEQAAPEGGEA